MIETNDRNEIEQRFPHLAGLPATLDDSTSGTPERRPGSVRRTSTIDMVWPDGFGTPLQLVGRSRDLLTPASGNPRVVDEASMRAGIDSERTITSIDTAPQREGAQGLIGSKGGAELRGAIDRALPGEREAATPLHLLLDDIAGASLIAGFAWSRSRPEFRELMSGARRPPGAPELGIRKGKVICSGLRPDGWMDTLRRNEIFPHHGVVPAGDVFSAEDPLAWHELPPAPEVGMRRHRRIDVWRENGSLRIDAFFRDACWEPDGSQAALHEYTVLADVDAARHTLRSVEPTPRVLPFPECKWAAPHASLLEGKPVSEFRTQVQQTLTELQACTHLNDMLRCLAEVPSLAAHL
jgi:hypothetical protein